jgi:transcriptional regulator with XRE-family HTH domain
MKRNMPVVAEFTDRYGDNRQVQQRVRGTFRVVRASGLTPRLAMNQALVTLIQRRIREARVAQGMSLLRLSQRMGDQPATKQRAYATENNISDGFRLATVYAAAIALDVPVGSLLPSPDEVLKLAKVRNGPVGLEFEEDAAVSS